MTIRELIDRHNKLQPVKAADVLRVVRDPTSPGMVAPNRVSENYFDYWVGGEKRNYLYGQPIVQALILGS